MANGNHQWSSRIISWPRLFLIVWYCIFLIQSNFFQTKGPSLNDENVLELLIAPYTDNIQVKMVKSMFNSIDLIDYFIVYVGEKIDCGKKLKNKIWLIFKYFFPNRYKEIPTSGCFAALKFNQSNLVLGMYWFISHVIIWKWLLFYVSKGHLMHIFNRNFP